MSSLAASPAKQTSSHAGRRGVVLVFCCTVLGAAAQILLKTGANHLTHIDLWSIVTSVPLIGGLSLYGVSTLLLVLALRDGELSLLYPVIALTYVWVTGLSFLVFHDRVNPIKLTGIAIIVAGVAILGRGSRT